MANKLNENDISKELEKQILEKKKVYKYAFFGLPAIIVAKNLEEAQKNIFSITGNNKTKIEELPDGYDLNIALGIKK